MKILQIDDSTQIFEMYDDYFTSDSNTIKTVNDDADQERGAPCCGPRCSMGA